MTILPVSDCHISENDDLKRFHLLGKLIIDRKPEKIIFMGDFLTLNCLSFWDKDKRKKMEGRRYKSEIKKGNEAFDIIFSYINLLKNNQRKSKIKLYSPEIIYLQGNHEYRLDRYLDKDPTFVGTVGIEKDLKLRQRGIKYIPYFEYYTTNGITFSHIFFNEFAEVKGADITKKVSLVTTNSCVFAHTHKMENSNWQKHGQKDLQQILNAGCFFNELEEYMKGKMIRIWKGLILLNNFKYGRFDIETFSLERLETLYER